MPRILPNESLLLALTLSLLISLVAWKFYLLTLSGALSALAIGFCIVGFGGFSWALILVLFFTTSSILSKLFPDLKEKVSEKYSKGSQRDWGQVLANGAFGALLAIAFRFSGENAIYWVAFCGAMASVTADTWATELGVLSPYPPRRINNGQIVEVGSSGGVSLYGTLAATCGGLIIGMVAWYLSPVALAPSWVLVITISGLFGAMTDSLLGATWQAIFYCPGCNKETERFPVHRCGRYTHLIRGYSWLNNDWVNFISSLAGSLIPVCLWFIL